MPEPVNVEALIALCEKTTAQLWGLSERLDAVTEVLDREFGLAPAPPRPELRLGPSGS